MYYGSKSKFIQVTFYILNKTKEYFTPLLFHPQPNTHERKLNLFYLTTFPYPNQMKLEIPSISMLRGETHNRVSLVC